VLESDQVSHWSVTSCSWYNEIQSAGTPFHGDAVRALYELGGIFLWVLRILRGGHILEKTMGKLWVTLVIIGIATFAYRASFIFFSGKIQLPARLQQALRFVPIAALTAIIVPELFVREGLLFASWQNERLVAGLVAVIVAWQTKSILLTLLLGMAVLYGLQWWWAAPLLP